MAVYKNSRQEYFEDGESGEYPCEVRLEEDQIIISIEDDDGSFLVYEGSEQGEGHYHIRRKGDPDARLTLHRFPDSKILEGSWIEDGSEGMWRIELGE